MRAIFFMPQRSASHENAQHVGGAGAGFSLCGAALDLPSTPAWSEKVSRPGPILRSIKPSWDRGAIASPFCTILENLD
jgi:hypothetical protein